MANNNFIVSVDIGSSKIAILLAEEISGRLEVFGHAIGKSAGVKKGVIVDAQLVADAIKKVAKAAYLTCNTQFHNVSVNISDPHLSAISRVGQIVVSADKVTQQDVDAAIKIARAVPIPPNKQVISAMANNYTLDRDPITHQGVMVGQPIGQQATTLEVGMYIVTASNQGVDGVEQSIRQSDLGLSNIVLNSMASSEAYITQEEKDNGVCLIDIGAGVMSMSVFTGGGISHSAVVQMGGNHITEAIMQAFDTSFDEAERLKLSYGHGQAKMIIEDKLIEFQQVNDIKDMHHYLSHQSLVEVIQSAYLELFSLVRDDLKKHKLYRVLKSGFVLTGGATKVKNCEELLLGYFRIRAKLGRVNLDRIIAERRLLDPVYGCALGLLLFEPNDVDLQSAQSSNDRNIFGKIKQQFKF